MSIQIPPGFAHCDIALRHTQYQRDAHVTIGVEPDNIYFEAVAQAVGEAFDLALMPRVDSQVQLRSVTATVGQDGSDPLVSEYIPSTPQIGGRSGDSTTVALAVLVSKVTNLGGRRNQGRMFLPWIVADTEVSELGIITASVVTSLQTACNTFRSTLLEYDVPPVLLHRTGATPVPSPTPIESFRVSNVISTQRRRQVRNP